MHFRAITRIRWTTGHLISGTMIIPGLVALIYRGWSGAALYPDLFCRPRHWSMLWWPNRKEKGELKSVRGF